MAAIEFQGLNQEFTTPSISKATAQEAPPSMFLERSALLSRVAWRFDNAERLNRYTRLSDLVVQALNTRVATLETAASRFGWPLSGYPGGGSALGARLVTPDDTFFNPKSLLSAQLRAQNENTPYYKYFSMGRQASSATDLAGRDYTFTMTQGGSSVDIDVSVPEGNNWGEVLQLTADAINNSSLSAQAEVITQTGAYNKIDWLPKTGSILAVTVNPAHADQDIEFRDTDGLLTAKLELAAMDKAQGAATLQRHVVMDATPASASTYTSGQFNPEGVPGITAGEHRLRLGVGGSVVDVPVVVDADMTWEELLEHVANRINLTDDRVTAQVVAGEMSSGQLVPAAQRSVSLQVTLDSPKRGERLSISEYGGPWLADVDGFHDPTNGLPNWVSGGERYVAEATANGWTVGRIYEYDGTSWSEATPEATNAVHNTDDGYDWFYAGSSWSTTASGTLAGDLGLNATAVPGADAQAHIDGRDMVSETGTFSLDRGRLLVDVDKPSGAGATLRVREAYGQIQERFMDVVTAYNDLHGFVMSHADLFEAGFTDNWSAPVRNLGTELEWLGVGEIAGSGELAVDQTTFENALTGNPDRAKAVLYDDGGLIPGLEAASSFARSPSLEDHLVQPNLLVDNGPPSTVEANLHKRGTLQEVVDAATEVPRPENNPFEDYASTLEDIIARKRAALETLDGALKATGRLFDSGA